MRFDDQQRRAQQTRRLFADHFHCRDQADGQTQFPDQILPRSAEQGGCRDGGDDQRKNHAESARKFGLNYGLAVGKDHEDTLALLLDNKAHAFATDDALLNSMIVRRKLQKEYMVVGEFLSYDFTASCSAG